MRRIENYQTLKLVGLPTLVLLRSNSPVLEHIKVSDMKNAARRRRALHFLAAGVCASNAVAGFASLCRFFG